MHELLYLKDEQIKAFIEKIFIAYRESFSDSKAMLNKHSLGLAHHKVIHLLSIYDGITISNLLKDWGLISIVKEDGCSDIAPLNQIKVLSYKDKGDWILEQKYNIGKKTKPQEQKETE